MSPSGAAGAGTRPRFPGAGTPAQSAAATAAESSGRPGRAEGDPHRFRRGGRARPRQGEGRNSPRRRRGGLAGAAPALGDRRWCDARRRDIETLHELPGVGDNLQIIFSSARLSRRRHLDHEDGGDPVSAPRFGLEDLLRCCGPGDGAEPARHLDPLRAGTGHGRILNFISSRCPSTALASRFTLLPLHRQRLQSAALESRLHSIASADPAARPSIARLSMTPEESGSRRSHGSPAGSPRPVRWRVTTGGVQARRRARERGGAGGRRRESRHHDSDSVGMTRWGATIRGPWSMPGCSCAAWSAALIDAWLMPVITSGNTNGPP